MARLAISTAFWRGLRTTSFRTRIHEPIACEIVGLQCQDGEEQVLVGIHGLALRMTSPYSDDFERRSQQRKTHDDLRGVVIRGRPRIGALYAEVEIDAGPDAKSLSASD